MRLLDRTVVATLPLLPRAVVRRFSARYIAGESTQDALRVVRQLNGEGVLGTIDLLGEDTLEPDEAEATRETYEDLLTAIDREGLDCNVSVKLTALGLKIDPDLCARQMHSLLSHARRLGNFIRIDMEDSSCTTATLELYRDLRRGFDNVGVVLQAYLRRSMDDASRLAEEKANVRLCKGIYIEPAEIAFRDRRRIQQSFTAILERLLAGGCYVGIATHDELLVQEARSLVARLGLTRTDYEFQMLLGVTTVLRQSLVAEGHRMRVYVPFGKKWYEYSIRRLKENPQIAGYAFKSLLRAS